MRILLPTGEAAYETVRKASEGFDVDVRITGKIASFLTPSKLEKLILEGDYSMVIVSGMCTADFSGVCERTGVPVYLGPRHAADIGMVLSMSGDIELSTDIPADDLISSCRKQEARNKLEELESAAGCDFTIKSLKIGGDSRIKVLAEIMDAHKRPDIISEVLRFRNSGADIIDLGFGFDATTDDVIRTFELVRGGADDIICAADTQDPALIRAALPYADIILSLQERNIPLVAEDIAKSGAAVVVVPGERSLQENIRSAQKYGIGRIIADPLLQPAGSGLLDSLCDIVAYSKTEEGRCPVFFGAGNVTELIDADSIGVNALLSSLAMEAKASIIFTSEHSDKTAGSVREMRRAVDMMHLASERPYPKDVGLSLFCIKEKRKRREPEPEFDSIKEADKMPDEVSFDPCGNFRIGVVNGRIIAVNNGTAVTGDHWEDIFHEVMKSGKISLLDHAAYLGKELYKAELAVRFGRSFEQDGPF
ncbi:dihydropteroate synthase-like protein [Methanoplanus limicola]|uniref:Dihydropteroate synthase-related protein n=1 Tax=Methanoplanus limicola DSM 2279 TaxID=937775 RepID=H1YXN4_9EURY|nr:dihydropteroate synthase-like protein [Methanoplanus limicola]EHQ35003.1 dihydropteroate synthase-related protein [Methanoplanus limicola DSM 2279]